MSTLVNLKLSSNKRPTSLPSLVIRRNKLGTRIWEQIQLAKAQTNGSSFTVKKFKTIKTAEGIPKSVELDKRVRQWWFVSDSGKLCFNIKYGTRFIELAKGKPTIEVNNNEELVSTLELIKQAVENGELDSQIEQASNKVKSAFGK